MKRLVLFVLFIVCTHRVFSQIMPSTMNECHFFKYLDSLKENNYNNDKYTEVKNNFKLRSNLLKRLEDYLLVFKNFEIAPTHLEDNADLMACPELAARFDSAYAVRKTGKHEARAIAQRSYRQDIRFMLLDLTDLNKANNLNVSKYIAELERAYTLEQLYHYLDTAFSDSAFDPTLYELPILVKENNLKLLEDRIDVLDQRNFVWYEHYNSDAQFMKGFEMHHDNDVLLLPFRSVNQDRELTGGFKFTIVTDDLKWRWLRLTKKTESRVLTYQTISVVGGGYTPYIRYRNDTSLADTLYGFDRPFASYSSFERAKHRTWRSGLVRHRGQFQIGFTGISSGRKIQAKLHEDFITTSQFVRGWDKQIADGGRLIFQVNHKAEVLLFSTTNRYATVFLPNTFRIQNPLRSYKCVKGRLCPQRCKHRDGCRRYSGVNVIGEGEVNIGSMITSMGGGIRLSSLDFLKQSGGQMIASRENSRDEFGWKLDIGFSYRWVIHNSLLQGLGIFETFDEDPYDKVVLDPYVLRKDQIQQNMWLLDYGVNLRWRKTTLYFRHVWHTLEYTSELDGLDFTDSRFTSKVDTKNTEYYNTTVIGEQNSFVNLKIGKRTIYGYGTIGVSWLIE